MSLASPWQVSNHYLVQYLFWPFPFFLSWKSESMNIRSSGTHRSLKFNSFMSFFTYLGAPKFPFGSLYLLAHWRIFMMPALKSLSNNSRSAISLLLTGINCINLKCSLRSSLILVQWVTLEIWIVSYYVLRFWILFKCSVLLTYPCNAKVGRYSLVTIR